MRRERGVDEAVEALQCRYLCKWQAVGTYGPSLRYRHGGWERGRPFATVTILYTGPTDSPDPPPVLDPGCYITKRSLQRQYTMLLLCCTWFLSPAGGQRDTAEMQRKRVALP